MEGGGGEREPLVGQQGRPHPPAFFSEAIWNIRPDVCSGFFALLGGAPEADMTVAYHAILEGNVLNAVFGFNALEPDEQMEGMREARTYLSKFMGDMAQERRIIYAYATLFRL